jgi:hypothetical protein
MDVKPETVEQDSKIPTPSGEDQDNVTTNPD